MRKIVLISSIKSGLFLLFCTGFLNQDLAQKPYEVDITGANEEIRRGHLNLGGKSIAGELIEVNNYYIEKNGKPYIPVMGEFHYCRYPNHYWDEEIKKMKAGGITVIATYVFWIIHEEKEGVFDWSADKNLRMFIELCANNNIKVIVRIGPFCHGEIRNGGLPDWLLGKPLSIRSNDPEYLKYVERFYNQIGHQLEGLLFKDGGPVFAIQLENEYQHSAAPWGITYPGQPYDWTAAEQDRTIIQSGVGITESHNPYASLGNEHMKILKSLAIKAGLEVPIYTATGWGYAAIIENESLPVTGAYAYPTWASLELSPFYLYRDIHKNPDYSPVRYKPEDYPNITAEIGGGIMVRYGRRPKVPAPSLDAIINRFVGSGANGIGYYMYHGGSTPHGEKVFFSDEAYAYPKISYDFQSPIGEFGQIRPSFNRLKVIHYFVQSFENELAPLVFSMNDKNAKLSPKNIIDLRYATRSDGVSGFIFMLNFQDHIKTSDISDIQLKLKTLQGELIIPEKSSFILKSEENAIFPFNLNLFGVTLNYATAQPLTKFKNGNAGYCVFFAPEGIIPEFSVLKEKGLVINKENCHIEDNNERLLITVNKDLPCQFSFTKADGAIIYILVVNREKAEQSWLTDINEASRLVFSNALMLQNENMLEFIQKNNHVFDIDIYPSTNLPIKTNIGKIEKIDTSYKLFTQLQITLPEIKTQTIINKISDNKFIIKLPDKKPNGINDYFLNIDYKGDVAMAFVNGELVADDFYYGAKWEIGLKKFMDKPDNKEMVFYFRPLYDKAPFYEDFDTVQIPDFSTNTSFFKINDISIVAEYKVIMGFN